jgi:hypothetical protein
MSNKNSPGSGDSKTAAEIIIWYWKTKKEIAILHVGCGIIGIFIICNNNNPFLAKSS